MGSDSVIVTLTTAWGSKFGGINSFNTELVKSLGVFPTRNYDLICIVPGEISDEVKKECSLQFGGMKLSALGGKEGEFEKDSAIKIVQLLIGENEQRRFYWIGHDDKTGPLALELRSLVENSRAVLINHMAYGAYQSIKKGISLDANKKKELQVELFRNADLCLAVGPMLQSHLDDLLACFATRPQVEMLVPGLTDPNEYEVKIRTSAPENFIVFVAGRLDKNDDRIKQGRLAIQGFGKAISQSNQGSFIQRSPTLRMRGIRSEEETELRNLLMEAAGRAVNFDFQYFTDDRTNYFRDLASASVAMMPSWHEGFGLTAWEAIASAIPVVISQESGVYRLLNEECNGIGLGKSVASIHVDGWLPSNDDEQNYTKEDVNRVASVLLNLSKRMTSAKQQALSLRNNLLRLGWDWKGTSEKLLDAIQRNFNGSVLTKPPKTSSETSVLDHPAFHRGIKLPEWLSLPERRKWKPSQHVRISMLLMAHDEIVNFDSERQSFLNQMLEWSSWSVLVSIRLVFAPGGMGKTRLALELVSQLECTGWQSFWLSTIVPREWEKSFIEILNSLEQIPILFVIDNADTRSIEELTVLTKTLDWIRTSDKKRKLRVLFLARSKNWIDNLDKKLSCSQELSAWLSAQTSIDALELPPWQKDSSIRLSSYRQALKDYSATLGISTPINAFVPRLSDKMFDRPLYLHLAALAAIEGQRPASVDALFGDQLRLEWRYWQNTYRDHRFHYDDWADALAIIILCQRVDTKKLRVLLQRLGVNDLNLADFLQRTYANGDYIAPLEPDVIADALLRERLAEHRGSIILEIVFGERYDQLMLSIPIVERLVAHTNEIETVQSAVWLQVIQAALIQHWPHHSNEWLIAAHNSEPGLGTLLFAVWQQLTKPVQIKLAKILNMPIYSINLVELNIAVHRLRMEIVTDLPGRAHELNDLFVALIHKGDKASLIEAFVYIRKAVQLYRELVQIDPEAYLPILAGSLTNLAGILEDQGNVADSAEALVFSRESVQILRNFAKKNPMTYLPELATSLSNISLHMFKQDKTLFTESIAYAREAEEIYRELVQTQPNTFRPDLALLLNNLASVLLEQNDPTLRIQALIPAREAVQIFRELAKIQPATYLRDLSMSLTNLSNGLSVLNDPSLHEEALSYAKEAVSINRKLVKIQSAKYLPSLANSLRCLANRLLEHGGDSVSYNEILSCIQESVRIFHELVKIQRATYLSSLADSLRHQAILFSSSDQDDTTSFTEALASIREAVQIYRELAHAQPSVYLHDLARALIIQANLSKKNNDATLLIKEFACAREALQIIAQLFASMPTVYKHDLDMVVAIFACKVLNIKKIKKNPEKEIKKVFKELAQKEPNDEIKAVFKLLVSKVGQHPKQS